MRSPSTDTPEHRQLLATARQYRRDGYRVVIPQPGDSLPTFLGDLRPDLIAEKDDDRVVVTIKRADAVPGSNDIILFAERVAPEPGWRFELIAVPPPLRVAKLETSNVEGEIGRLLGQGFTKPAFLIALAAIENVLAYAVDTTGLKSKDRTMRGMAHDLAFLGLISDEDLVAIETASKRRNSIVHGIDGAVATAPEVEVLARLKDRLMSQVTDSFAA